MSDKMTGGVVIGYDNKVSSPTKVTDDRLWRLINSSNPLTEQYSIYKELKSLRQLISELKEDNAFWFDQSKPTHSGKGEPGFNGTQPQFCDFCDESVTHEHKPDCPITLHAALMEKIEKEVKL